MHERLKDFVFPDLHALSMDSITGRLTDGIRATIPDETRKKDFTTRSTRKGAMGENRMNQNLTLKQEYARSGHTGPEQNSNAEGYIDSLQAMNAAGGMSLAGFKEANTMVWPYTFDPLGLENCDAVNRLINVLFPNDIERLELNGKLRSLLVTAAARIVGSYNKLLVDVGNDNAIVQLIQTAARTAKIDDTTIPVNDTLGPRWKITLRDWSSRVDKEFKSKNSETVPENAPWTEQLTVTMSKMQSIGKLVETMGGQMHCIASDSSTMQSQMVHMQSQFGLVVSHLTQLSTAVAQLAQQQQQQSSRDVENEKLLRKIRRLEAMLINSPESSPAAGVKRGAEADPHSPADKRGRISLPHNNSDLSLESVSANQQHVPQSLEIPTPSIMTAPALLPRLSNATATDVLPQLSNATLDGIPINNKATSGVTVVIELERLWNNGLVKRAVDAIENGRTLSKRILFDPRVQYFVGYNPNFVGNEQSRYVHAMTVVAMSFQETQWTAMCRGELDDKEKRMLFAAISAATLDKCLELEGKAAGSKSKAGAGLVSVGTRFQASKKKWKNEKKKEDVDFVEMIMEKCGDGRVGGQTNLNHFFKS